MTPSDVELEPLQSNGLLPKIDELLLRSTEVVGNESIRDQFKQARFELADSWQISLKILATVLSTALHSESDSTDCGPLLSLLADSSRDVALRQPFGPYPETTDAEHDPQCILGVSLDIIKAHDKPSGIIKDALRLVANCCADQDQNRRYVVHRDGLSLLLAMPDISSYADFVIPALYNVCVDFKDISTDAERENGSRRTNAAQKQLAAFKSAGGQDSFEILIGLCGAVQDNRKSFLSDVIEMTSRPASESLDYLLDGGSLNIRSRDEQLSLLLQTLLISQQARRLSRYSRECCVCMCNTVINILSQEDARIALLRLDALMPFLTLPYRHEESEESSDDEDEDGLEDLRKCRRTHMKLLYEMTAMSDFQERYTLESTQIQQVITCLRDAEPISTSCCVVLANVITSLPVAEDLVAKYQIHEAVMPLLKEPDLDYFPVIGLLMKLALPETNKRTLAQSGLFDSFLHILELQSSIEVQREAVATTRLLIKGQPANFLMLSDPVRPNRVKDGGGNLLSTILDIFVQTADGSLKSEIGRLIIEVCRMIFKQDDAETQLERCFGGNPAAARAIAFVSYSGQGGARSEGWFGLAMLSIFAEGRAMVMSALEDKDLQKEMQAVAVTKEGPSLENLRLMLTKLQPSLANLSDETKPEVDLVLQEAGLISN